MTAVALIGDLQMSDITRLHIPIEAVSLSTSDVKSIFERLFAIVAERGSRAAATLVKPPEEAQDAFEQRCHNFIASAFRVTVTIKGVNGLELYGDNTSLFLSPELPEIFESIFMTNTVAFASFSGGRNPPETFSLFLDFSKPPLLDGSRLPSAPTPNASELDIVGSVSWVSAVKDAVEKTLDNRKNGRGRLHISMIYDFGLMVMALPLALYGCWKLSLYVSTVFGSLSPFLVGTVYLYIVLSGLWIYRAMFGYLKWAFPIVEHTDTSRAGRHRKFWFGILCLILIPIALDLTGSKFWD
jgi:hypothetical protein